MFLLKLSCSNSFEFSKNSGKIIAITISAFGSNLRNWTYDEKCRRALFGAADELKKAIKSVRTAQK